ncbi:MAG: 6-bladed beta-propeller [Candidatus Thorarchaeota archaeon]|jgi:DNA-binding beta-propeller fold protein YncE
MKRQASKLFTLVLAALMLMALLPTAINDNNETGVQTDSSSDNLPDTINNQMVDEFNLTNDYDKIWEPNNIRGSTHAIAVSDDNEWMATAGGYLNDREIHIYRWFAPFYQYLPIFDAGDGIFMGDVMDVDFMDSDNNGMLEIVAGCTDGRIYVFEQLGEASEPFNVSSLSHQWELVWDSGLYIDSQIWSVLAYDIDHDSHDEIIAGAWDNKVYVFDYIDHSAYPYCMDEHWIQFDPVWDSGDTITGVVNSVAVVDSDADTRMEIVAGSEDHNVYLFEERPCMKHTYELMWTSGEAIWAPVVSVTASQDLDDDEYGEIVASAYGQGVYVFEYNSISEEFDVRKLNQGIKSWERGISMPPASVYTGYEADEYIDRKVFGWPGYGVFEYGTIPPPYDTVSLGGESALGGPWDNEETTFESTEQFVYQGQWDFEIGSDLGEFSVPYDMLVTPDGSFYISDLMNDRVTKFSENLEPILMFGESGNETGQFDMPAGITMDDDGFIYVADGGNSRVQKFTLDGEFVDSWGTNGSLEDQFYAPFDVAIWEDRLYVADALNDRIQVLNKSTGEFLSRFGTSGPAPTQFDYPAGLAFDADGRLVVCDYNNHRIQRFSTEGVYIDQVGTPGITPGQFNNPIYVTIDADGRIYVSDKGNHRVQKFGPSLQYESEFGQTGSDPGEFQSPWGLAIHPDGGIVVLDSSTYRLQRFGVQEYELLEVFNSHEDQSGAYDIAFDSEGNFYVTDDTTPNVFKFSPEGVWLANWTIPGSGFPVAQGVEINDNDTVYIYDSMNSKIYVYDTEGNLDFSFGSLGANPGELRGIMDIAVDDYQIYITEFVNNRVSVFDYAGAFRYTIGSPGAARGEFNGPYGIEIGPDDLLYVSEQFNGRIQRFFKNGTSLDIWVASVYDRYMAFDDEGYLYTSGMLPDAIKKYTPNGVLVDVLDYEIGNPEVEKQGFISSEGIVWRSENQSFFVCDSSGKIYMMRPYLALNDMATAVVDFGQWEEIGGDATDDPDMLVVFVEDIDLENVEFQITNDFETWQPLSLSTQYCDYEYTTTNFGLRGLLHLDVDHALRSAQWDEFRYLRIGVKGGVIYNIDGANASVARPIVTALVVTTGFIHDGSADDGTEKIIVGTVDGEIMAYTADGRMVWESQADQPKFSLDTSIWDIVQVNGKALVPTWIEDGDILDDADVTISVPGFSNFISYSLVNIDGTTDLDIVATIQDGSDAKLIYYRNIGSNEYPSYLYIPNYFITQSSLITDLIATHATVTMADMDGDLDLDMIICDGELFPDSTWTFSIRYFEQTSPLFWTEQSGYLSDLNPTVFFGDFVARVSPIDMDYDGDLDITLSLDKLYYFEQRTYTSGSGFWFDLDETVYEDINFAKQNETVFGNVAYWDFDLDGDIDVIVPHASENYTGHGYKCETGRFTYWRNTGNRFNIEWTKTRALFEPDFTGTLLNPERGYDYPAFRDMNGDGIFDFICMNEDAILIWLGDMNHDTFLCATYPYIHMVEVDKRTQDDGYWGYEAYDSWTNWRLTKIWSMSLEYGDVDQDGIPEVFVGSFDSNIIAFEQVAKNTYRRSWRSLEFFPQPWQIGIIPPFQTNVLDMVIGDQDQDGIEELIVCAGLNIYVFEAIGDDMYEIVWVSDDIEFWVAGQSAKDDPTPKIPFVVAVDEDLDNDGWSEIIVGAQDFLIVYENTDDNNYTMVANYELDNHETGNPFIRGIMTEDIDQDGFRDIVVVGSDDVVIASVITSSYGWAKYFTCEMIDDETPLDNSYIEFHEDYPFESGYCVDIADLDLDDIPEIFIGDDDGIHIFESDATGTPIFLKLLPTVNASLAVKVGNTDGDSWSEVVVGAGKNLTVFEQNSTWGKELHIYDQVWTSGELHDYITDICLGDSNRNNRTEIIATAVQGYLYAFEWVANSSDTGFTPAFEELPTTSKLFNESAPAHEGIMAFLDNIYSDLRRLMQETTRRFSFAKEV